MSLLQSMTAGVLVVAVLAGSWRVLRAPRSPPALRIAGQLAMAGLLYLLLYPPGIDQPGRDATVLTPGVSARQLSALDPGTTIIALPGVVADDHAIEHVPDLASALRRHADIASIRVLGDGLPARDRGALEGRGLTFEPGEKLIGVVALNVPSTISEGALWTLRGQISVTDKAHLRLLDRSGAVIATTQPDDDGNFRLELRAPIAGETLYRLQLLDANESLLEELPIGVDVRAGDSLRTLILAGAADAEVKYLRRWIMDSGSVSASRISLSRGIEQRQNDVSLDPQALAELDLLILDERSWAGLGEAGNVLIRAAVEQGLGVILRVSGPLPAQVAKDWTAFGLRTETTERARTASISLAGAEAALTRAPLDIEANDSVPLLKASDGSALAVWRMFGHGRIALWLPQDTFRLQLSGDEGDYANLWSETFSTLGRARGAASPDLPVGARVNQRSSICDIGPEALIEDMQTQRQRLLVDSSAGDCAAWWPSQAGWQHLLDGEARWPVFVWAADEATSLLRQQTRDATRQLVNTAGAKIRVPASMPRWPLFLVWLLVSAALWWIERRAQLRPQP